MWLLQKPSVAAAKTQLVEALTLKDGTVVYGLSNAEKAAVATAYRLYDHQKGRHHANLETCGLTDACRTAIHSSYGQVQKRGRLASLRQSLLDDAETCPFCGFAEPTQLDHYLPKEDYKALSIYGRNLIPSCGPCNNAKRRHVGGPADEFVHPYFDTLPDIDFLVATVTMGGASLSTRFSINPAGLLPDIFSSLTFQMTRMNLNSRYRKQVNLFLFAQRTGMLRVFGRRGTEGLRRYLLKSARDLAEDFGRNDWRAAFMRGLAECDAFCDGGLKKCFAKRRRRRRAAA
ncbi:HNH endonuclease [Xanthobacter versatilis]|uniref:HNH endonuclease n=1 Tax=Xanthobacter autotrophicus (strain ATCC BAA-1158 / Py2) TaxID=78245 RepID=UPI00372BA8AC